MYKVLRIKLPRKVKKTYKALNPERCYKKIASRMITHYEHPNNSVLYKILDYKYCIEEADRGYVPSWPEITNHRLFKIKSSRKKFVKK